MSTKEPMPAKAKGGEFRHPMLDQARKLAQEGRPEEAAQLLVTLAEKVKPYEKGQLLAFAADFLCVSDRDRAAGLAEEATRAAPELPQAWIALSNVLLEKRDRNGAIAAALHALDLPKINPAQLANLGRQLSRLGQDAKSLEAVKKGYELSGRALNLAPPTLRVALQYADWDLSGQITAMLAREHAHGKTAQIGETPRTHVLWCGDDATNIAVISNFAEKTFPARPPLVQKPWPHDGKRKLRVGYLSYDYRDHATSLLAMGMMRHHDRDHFEWYGYCTSFDDGSAMRRDILSRFDKVRTFNKVSDMDAAKRIAADKVDILVDLNGLTEGTRHGILAWRPAPVQIGYLGFPGTVGGRFVDYIIGDEHTVPQGAEALYPEHVIRLPHTYQINDYRARYLPPRPARRPEGLPPAGAPVLGMFNNVNKLNPEVWGAWMKIMAAVPTAVLWLLQPGDLAREHLVAATRAAGIDPARLIFAPRMKQEPHFARLQYCDLMLDPWPYGGHTTTSDALFAGVPVLALRGTNFASRVSGGLLRAAGLPGLEQADIASYIRQAVHLLNHPDECEKIRRYLLRNRMRLPLFDAPGRTRHLEAAYREAYVRALRGQPPSHLTVREKRKPAPAAGPLDAGVER